MATMSSFLPFRGFRSIHHTARHRSHLPNPSGVLRMSTVGLNYWLLMNQGLKMSGVHRVLCSTADSNMEVGIDIDDQSPDPVSPEPSKPSWIRWILGSIITIILPYWKNPLSKLEDKVEAVIDVVDNMVEAVEKVANAVEDAASDVADKLHDGKLKDAVLFVENLSKEVGDQADAADDIIDKVDDIREKVEDLIEADFDLQKLKEEEEKKTPAT